MAKKNATSEAGNPRSAIMMRFRVPPINAPLKPYASEKPARRKLFSNRMIFMLAPLWSISIFARQRVPDECNQGSQYRDKNCQPVLYLLAEISQVHLSCPGVPLRLVGIRLPSGKLCML